MQNTTEVEHHYHQGLESIQDDPQCCTCEILTLTPEISPWEERKSVRDLHQILTISPEVRLLERAHFRVMESSTLHIQPSLTNLKTSSATLCEYTEPKSSSVGSSSSIPNYVFLHQKAPSFYARDYRKNYTYPNMERQIMSNHLRRGVGSYSHPCLSTPLSVTPKLIVLGECMADTKLPTSNKLPVKVPPIQSAAVSAHPRLGEARFLLPRRIVKPPPLRNVPSLLMYPNDLWKNVKPVPLHVPIRGSSIELKRPNASEISQNKTDYYCPPATLHFDPGILPYAPINPGKVVSKLVIGRIDSASLIPHRRNYKPQH